jgi:hypothetical protein
MPYEIRWQQDKRIIYGRIYGDSTLEDADHWSREIVDYLETGIEPVHLVIDTTTVKKIPTNITALKGSMKYLNHPKLGWNVVIGGPVMVHTFAQIIARITHIQYKTARDLGSALEFLRAEDATLVVP